MTNFGKGTIPLIMGDKTVKLSLGVHLILGFFLVNAEILDMPKGRYRVDLFSSLKQRKLNQCLYQIKYNGQKC